MKGTLHLFSVGIIVLFGTSIAALAQAPVVDTSRGAVNSASFISGQAVAPGSLITIFGSNFATSTSQANTVPISTSLADVSVSFNGVNAPISLVFHDATGANPDQINAQLPWEVLPMIPAGTNGTVQMVVTRSGVPSLPTNVPVAATGPGIFAITIANGLVVGNGVGQAIAYTNTDGQIAAPTGSITGLNTHPAKVGDQGTLVILATGLGQVDTTVRDGDVPDVITSNTVTTPTVTIGNVPAKVVFSGMVGRDSKGTIDGFVGVYQINVVVDPTTPTGDAVPLQISMNGGSPSTAKVTIAVSK